MRRVSTETAKPNARALAKYATGNGLIIFDTMMGSAKQYDNMIEAMVTTLSNCGDLALDMMSYTLLRQLSDTKSESLESEGNVADWL